MQRRLHSQWFLISFIISSLLVVNRTWFEEVKNMQAIKAALFKPHSNIFQQFDSMSIQIPNFIEKRFCFRTNFYRFAFFSIRIKIYSDFQSSEPSSKILFKCRANEGREAWGRIELLREWKLRRLFRDEFMHAGSEIN